MEVTNGSKLEQSDANDSSLEDGLDEMSIKAFWDKAWPKLVDGGWEKVTVPPGTLDEAGITSTVILTTKTGLDIKTSILGKDYYIRIKDVIERVNERQNTAEASAADQYRRAVSKTETKVYRPDFAPCNTRQKRKQQTTTTTTNETSTSTQSPPSTPHIDLSWKVYRKHFPKKSSRIGDEYQATNIPHCKSYKDDTNQSTSDTYCEPIWDPSKAKDKGIVLDEGTEDVILELPSNIREQALIALSENDYNVKHLETITLKPMDGSDWTKVEKEKFALEIFRLRRNIPSVAKVLQKPIKICHAYYLGTYKQTSEYRWLKTICIEERENSNSSGGGGDNDKNNNNNSNGGGGGGGGYYGRDACAICGDGGNLLICDGCEGEYHMKCLQPALAEVPKGRWECDECVDQKFLDAHEQLLKRTKLFEKVEAVTILESNNGNNRKRSADEAFDDDNNNNTGNGGNGVQSFKSMKNNDESSSSSNNHYVYRPIPSAVETVKQLAIKIRKILNS